MASTAQEASLAATGETPETAATQAQPHPSQPGAEPQTKLQDILPEIKDLASRVGGMDQLADLVATLRQSKE